MIAPRQYEGGGTSTFEQLVGATLGGYDQMDERLRKRRDERRVDEKINRDRRREDIEEQVALEQGGYSVNGAGIDKAPTNSRPGIDRPAAAGSVARAGGGSAAAPSPAVQLPPGVTPFNPRARIGPDLEEDAEMGSGHIPSESTPMPVAHADASTGAPAPTATPEEKEGTIVPRRNFLQKVGHALGATAQSVRNTLQNGGDNRPAYERPTVTRTGPSAAERAQATAHTARMEEIGAREANDAEIASIRANATTGAARIRAAASAARATGSSSEMNRVLIDIDKEVGRHLSQIRILNADPRLKNMRADDPASVAAANSVRQQIRAEQEAVNQLNDTRADLRNGMAGTGVRTNASDRMREKAAARAQALMQHANTSPASAGRSIEYRKWLVATQLKNEGFNVVVPPKPAQ